MAWTSSSWEDRKGLSSESGSDGAGLINEQTGQYRTKDPWHERMEVQQGSARERLDMSHGFLKSIVSARHSFAQRAGHKV